jgi:hypothetical protein
MKTDKRPVIWAISFLVTLLSFGGQTALSETADWNSPKKEGKGIKVYTRSVKESSVDEFKGVVAMETSLSALCSLMNSFSDYPNWLYNCRESRSLEKIGDKKGYVYIVYKIKFWSDRDVVLRYEFTQREDKSIFIKLEGEPTFKPEEKDLVRVRKASGHWKFTPKQKGSVEVEYQLHMDPDLTGAWFVGGTNRYVPDVPYYTLDKLREEVKRSEHVSASPPEWLK